MKWLITGAAGFIGANAAATLAGAGEECVLVDNFHRPGARYNQAYLRERVRLPVDYLDVRFPDQVNAYWTAHRDAGVIMHLAGQVSSPASVTDPRYDFETNALGTFNVLEATRRFVPEARLIYASTNKVYGDLRGLLIEETGTRYTLPDYPDGLDEGLSLDPRGGYACSKGAAERYVLDYHRVHGLASVVLRQSSIYGARQYASEDQGWVAYFVQMGVERRRFRTCGAGKQVRDLLHVSDLIECYRAIAGAPRESLAFGQAFNIGGGPASSLSLVELFALLETRYGFRLEYTAGPPRRDDQKVFVADTRKARQYLGWGPTVSVVQGMDELVEWSTVRWAAGAIETVPLARQPQAEEVPA